LPGITLTDYVKSHVPQALFDIMLGETLDKELGQPADIANAVVFLASDAARHINGHILVVDGGESVHAPNIAALARLGSDMGMQEYQKL
jgi:NAD(P)-dependent dehydrogenase (short-subunit alcohol dehydrogenase family)